MGDNELELIYNVTIKMQMAFDYDMWVCPTI